ncbi:MAG: prepilin-type N-terminal cleavage/methylation domain-containing protein [Candidatus Brocadia sp.]|jgi:type II secretory pathway pseudopilin PulG
MNSDKSDIHGFTLFEVIVGIAIITAIAGSIATLYPLDVKIMERETTGVEISMIARSIKSAIITGARENFNPQDNSFFFIYEGVAVQINLPPMGKAADFPGDMDDLLRNRGMPDSAAAGLYPAGLLYRGQVMQQYRLNAGSTELRFLTDENGSPVYNTFIGPSLEEDFNLSGAMDNGEDINGNGLFDTFEDVGVDGLRDEMEPGYNPVHNPDPSGDNFDPVRNPSGTERNGRFDTQEPFSDTNGNGIRDPDETFADEDGDGRFDGETDLNKNGYLDVPDRKAGINGLPLLIKTYFQNPSLRITNYGYTVRALHQSLTGQNSNAGNNVFTFEIAVYKDFFKVRPALRSARQDVLDASALPEVNSGNMTDDDGDGVTDDAIVAGMDGRIDRNLTNGAAIPEIILNGIDDDNDGAVDDGLIKPDFVERFQIAF